jgi:hypothetical protein
MLYVSDCSPKGVAMMDQTSGQTSPAVPLLAAVPPLLLGLGLALQVIIFVPLRSIVWGAATPLRLLPRAALALPPLTLFVAVILVLAAGAAVGLWRRAPAWSHTWTSSTVVAIALALSILGDDVPYLISPIIDQLIALGLVLALALVALVAARRSMTEAALVAMGFGSAFSLVVVFSSVASPMLRMDLALGAAPAGLAFTLLMAAFLRRQGGARWIALLLTAVLSAALIGAYGLTVTAALSADLTWQFLRVLGPIGALGLSAPLALGWLFSLRRPPALRSA